MASYGYARVSTLGQDLDLQVATLTAAGCTIIRQEKKSGSSMDGRTELQIILDFAQRGDVVVVTRIDRLARSMRDLQNIVHELAAKGVALRATEQPIDTSTAAGKAFLDMLGVFAEFETNLRRERQAEGVAAAKAKDVYKGRQPSVDRDAVLYMLATGDRPTDIARKLGINRSTVYRIRDEHPVQPPSWQDLENVKLEGEIAAFEAAEEAAAALESAD